MKFKVGDWITMAPSSSQPNPGLCLVLDAFHRDVLWIIAPYYTGRYKRYISESIAERVLVEGELL